MLMQGFEKPDDTGDSFMTTDQVLNKINLKKRERSQ
jgi:hypothetical protein